MNKRRISIKVCRGHHLKNAWSVDYDYTKKLDNEELDFLAGFTQYFYHGRPDKMEILRAVTDDMKRESYARNNRAIRDIMNRGFIPVTLIGEVADTVSEDYVIDLIDKRDINSK
jgi:hypothetical protein